MSTELVKSLRKLSKDIKFHDPWCPYPKTATCLCGKNHSIALKNVDLGEKLSKHVCLEK